MNHRLSLPTVVALATSALLPPPVMGQLAISGVRRVAAGEAVRDRPSVAVGPVGYRVVWEEAPTMVPSTDLGRNFRILQQEVAFDGTLFGTPTLAMADWSHQWGASPAMSGERSWLAYYFADRSMRTGDRDLGLTWYSGFFDRPEITFRLSQDPSRGPPINHSSPALLYDPEAASLIVASSIGAYLGEPRPGRPSYDSVNIEVRVMDLAGTEQTRWQVKGPDEVGEAATPALAILPPEWRERYILGYVSNAGQRDNGVNGYSVWLELYDRDWRVVGGRHLLHPLGGAARPALATVDGKLFIAWVDNATNDIVISELDQNLHPSWPVRLRDALGAAGFAEQFGAGAPGLSSPALFDNGGRLGVAFVATWEWDVASGRARQEIFLGTVAYRH
ncbi:MAG: hypothetical protein SGI84_06635 [Gemmatimonadota bacterium]|nr:hypothetical protein [Gemmatimonadota bacterium]